MKNSKVAIIGCGNIGISLLQGLLKEQTIPAGNITATRRNISELVHLKEFGVRLISDNIEAVRESDLIIIAVKPYNIVSVLEELKDHLDSERHVLISVTAGVTVGKIREVIGDTVPVFRAMPNIAASVGKSVTCICYDGAKNSQVEAVRFVFDIIGTTMIIDEDLMESATILGACGIAYVLRFIRAMIQGGIQIGFDAATASEIVNQTVKGAAELLIERHQHPEFEIDKVTTPKGCTIVGLNEMEHNGFSSSLIKGLVASYDKIEKKPDDGSLILDA
jgi:pyrroline-5-carboxylate reductase